MEQEKGTKTTSVLLSVDLAPPSVAADEGKDSSTLPKTQREERPRERKGRQPYRLNTEWRGADSINQSVVFRTILVPVLQRVRGAAFRAVGGEML
jgi:hypothetical protein